MKKILLIIITFLFVFKVSASEVDLAKNAKGAILVESTTGKVIYEKESNVKRSPASMTKIMTLLLTMEALDNDMIKLSDKVTISKTAAGMGGTQIFIEEGSRVSVDTLIKGITIASANDAAVAIAEYVGGTLDNFVLMMNKRAKELGCTNTSFKNPHGLDEKDHYTTPYDLSLIARELLKHKKILEYTSTYEDHIDVSGENHWLVNTNKLVRFYKGIDGLKTGYTSKAGYCLAATMEKNNMRLLSIVMKEDTKENRSSDTISMMEYGYSQYGIENIINKDKYSGKLIVNNAKKREVTYYLNNDVNIISKKGARDINYEIKKEIFNIKAPLKKNSIVGKLKLSYDNKTYDYDLVIKEDIKKANVFNIMKYIFKDLISGTKVIQ